MKSWFYLVGLLAGGALLSGCAGMGIGTASTPPSGVMPGGIFTEVNYPSYRESQTKFSFKREDLEILGPVSATAESQNILGLVATGDNGYSKLLADAKAKYPTCDAVINIQWDTQWNSVCCGIVSKAKSTAEGTAVRIKR